MRKIFFVLLILLFSCHPSKSFSGEKIKLTKYAVEISLQNKHFWVELAESPQEKRQGLMYRKSLEKNQGMLFIYAKPRYFSFWMKNTPVSIDIGFFDKENKLAQIRAMQPYSEKVHNSSEAGIYALEMPSGWFDKNKILLGAKLRIIKKELTKNLDTKLFAALP